MNTSTIPNGRWGWLAAEPEQPAAGVCHACSRRAVAARVTEPRQPAARTQAAESELEEEIKRPALRANLKWSGPYSYATITHPDFPLGGKRGFYIAFSGDLKTKGGVIHKVGQTTRDFRARFETDPRYKAWRYYLGLFSTGIDDAIEHAITRTLMRAGLPLPDHKQPRDVLLASGPIRISHPLPADLVQHLKAAYSTSTYPYAGRPPTGNTLRVPKDQLWELEP